MEADVYAGLGDRIDWFETVVGDLQPILQAVQRTIRQAEIATGSEREDLIRCGIESLRSFDPEAGPLSDWKPTVSPPKVRSPLTFEDLSEVVREVDLWKTSIEPRSRADTFRLVDGNRDLTSVHSIAEDECVALCTYNVPEFERLMSLPEPRPRTDLLRLERHMDRKVVGYYGWVDGRWQPIRSLAGLRSQLGGMPPAVVPEAALAVRMFESTLESGR